MPRRVEQDVLSIPIKTDHSLRTSAAPFIFVMAAPSHAIHAMRVKSIAWRRPLSSLRCQRSPRTFHGIRSSGFVFSRATVAWKEAYASARKARKAGVSISLRRWTCTVTDCHGPLWLVTHTRSVWP